MNNEIFDFVHSVRASFQNSERRVNPCNCETLITHREIWQRAPKAAARKATADGVIGICLDEKDGGFYIFQIGGYTRERGAFCDMLDEKGRVVHRG